MDYSWIMHRHLWIIHENSICGLFMNNIAIHKLPIFAVHMSNVMLIVFLLEITLFESEVGGESEPNQEIVSVRFVRACVRAAWWPSGIRTQIVGPAVSLVCWQMFTFFFCGSKRNRSAIDVKHATSTEPEVKAT